MMKKAMAFLLGMLIGSAAMAQEPDVNLSTLLDPATPSGSVEQIYTGRPVVAMGPTVGVPVKGAEPEFIPTPVNWPAQTKMVRITTPLGEKLDVPYLSHVPYDYIVVNVMTDGSVSVDERYPLILTEPMPFVRVYDKGDRAFTQVSLNGRPAGVLFDREASRTILKLPDLLGAGVHNVAISYVIPNGVRNGELLQSLTQMPYPIERMGVLVNLPTYTEVYQKQIVFGRNNVLISDAVQMEQQASQIAFKTTRLIPEMTDVRLRLIVDQEAWIRPPFITRALDLITRNLGWIIGIFGALMILGYNRLIAFLSPSIVLEKDFIAMKKPRYWVSVMRLVLDKKVDNRTFCALMFSLMNKGCLTLEVVQDDVKITFKQNKEVLSPAERSVLAFLFKHKKEVMLSSLKAGDFISGKLQMAVDLEQRSQYMALVYPYTVTTWVLAALCGVALYMMDGTNGYKIGISVPIVLAGFLGLWILKRKSVFMRYIRDYYTQYKTYLRGLVSRRDLSPAEQALLTKNVAYLCVFDLLVAAQKVDFIKLEKNILTQLLHKKGE